MLSRIVPLLAVLTALAAAAAPASGAELGLNMNGGVAAYNDPKSFEDLSTLKAKWARHFVFWDDLDHNENGFGPYSAMERDEESRGVKTLLTVASARGAAPDADQYAAFMGKLATRFKGQVEAYEIWNEADGSMFWSGGPNAAAYVDTLKKAYAAVKAADPNATVVFSPTIGNNFHFVQAAYDNGAKGFFDAMAVHTDTACLDRGPTSFYREPDGRIAQFAFLGYREVYKVMQANGDGAKPIWMTEFGWSAAQHTCEYGDGAGQRPAGVSEADQAAFLTQAMNCLELDPYVTVAMWFNNKDIANDQKMANMYGLRRYDNSTRPAFDAFQTWGNGGGRSSAPCGDFEGPAVEVLEPKPGFVLAEGSNLTLRARSTAPDLNRIFFSVVGPGAEPLFAGGPISLPVTAGTGEREWGGARDLLNGSHRLLVWATDTNGTPGNVVEIPFTKGASAGVGAGGGAGGSLVRFPKIRLTGRGLRRTYSGAALPGITSGALRIEWQKKTGRRWRRLHSRAVAARSPFRVTQRLRGHGTWRVRAMYLGRPGIPKKAVCWTVFNTRTAKKKLSCPKGSVRPSK